MPSKSALNVSLPPELLRLIGEDVGSGQYQSASEVVRAALRGFYRGPAKPGHTGTTDATLTRSQHQVEALFAQAAAGMAQTDLTGRFVRVNDQYCAILGRPREELLQLRMQDLTHPDDLPHNMTLFRRALETGEAFEIEKRYLRQDGSLVWVRNAVSPIRDSSGKPDSLLAVFIDITGYENAQEELRESETLKSAILDAALDCIVSIDHESRVIEWNPAAERTFGYSREVALGRDLAALIIPPEYRERHRQGMARYLATGEGAVLNTRIELEALRADGSRFPVELAISPIGRGGKPRFTAYLRDITERKRAEQHQWLLLNELNHRVKNTLATVQSIVFQTLRNAPSPEEAQTALSSRLIALSRAHDVLTRESWEAASLDQVVSEAMEPFRAHGESRIKVAGSQVRLPPSMALAVAMALQELATNAVKYGALSNEAGEVEIRWSLDETNSPAHLHLRWEESGGPPVRLPNRRGFGTRLIERGLAGDLHGEAKIEFAPTGLVCTITAPVPDRMAMAA